MKRFLSSGEVARIFGVNRSTVRRWAQRGRLPTTRTLGGHIRYPRDAVTRLYHARQARERMDYET